MLEAALSYAGRGFRVLPLHSTINGGCSCHLGVKCPQKNQGKHPRIRKWQNKATTDEKQIRLWWKRWPDAHIGLATGEASGVFVFDVDGPIGAASLERLEEEHGDFPETLICRTGTGGLHYYFAWPRGHKIGNRQGLFEGIDIRGEGGFVVAPPSRNFSGGYEWIKVFDIADAPLWLLEHNAPNLVVLPARSLPTTDDKKLKRAAAYCAKIDPAVQGQGGQSALFKAGMVIGCGFDLGESETVDLLWREFNPRCSPPWGDDEHKDFARHVREGRSKGGYPVGSLLGTDDAWSKLHDFAPRMPEAPPMAAPPPEAYEVDELPEEITVTPMTAADLQKLLHQDPKAFLRPDILAKLIASRADNVEWYTIQEVIQSMRGRALSEFKRHVKAIDEEHNNGYQKNTRDSGDLFGMLGHIDPSIGGSARIPPGFAVVPAKHGHHAKLCKVVVDRKGHAHQVEICERVPIISAFLHYLGGQTSIEVAWPNITGKSWTKRIELGSKVFDANKLVQFFGDYLSPITSENRKDIVRWLAAYRDTNRLTITKRRVSEQLGWQPGECFLAGKDSDCDTEFGSPGAGETQYVAGLDHKAGTKAAWLDVVKQIHGHPKLEIALYASLAAPLLKILGAQSFALEWAGKTSSGKTSALRLAASVWGSCAPSDDDSLIQNWSGTKIGAERYLSTMRDLPTFVDDTQTARSYGGKRSGIEEVIYQLTSGGGMRGAKEGSREVLKWRTVLLSTGEEKISSLTSGGGAAARVLSIWGSPLDGVANVSGFLKSITQNYGHAGREWTDYLAKNRHRWIEWQDLHRRLADQYLERLSDKPDQGVAARQADCMAVLGVAAQLAIDALDLPWGSDEFDAVAACVDIVGKEMAQSSKPRLALEHVADYAGANMSRILNTETARNSEHFKKDRDPNGGWLGKLTDEHFYIYPGQLKKILGEHGMICDGIVRQWCDLGIIDQQCDGRISAMVSIDGARVSVYRLSLDALAKAGLDVRRKTATIDKGDRSANVAQLFPS